jgi:hypothetical protein
MQTAGMVSEWMRSLKPGVRELTKWLRTLQGPITGNEPLAAIVFWVLAVPRVVIVDSRNAPVAKFLSKLTVPIDVGEALSAPVWLRHRFDLNAEVVMLRHGVKDKDVPGYGSHAPHRTALPVEKKKRVEPEARLLNLASVTCMIAWVIAGYYVLLWVAAFHCEGGVGGAPVQSGRSAGNRNPERSYA